MYVWERNERVALASSGLHIFAFYPLNRWHHVILKFTGVSTRGIDIVENHAPVAVWFHDFLYPQNEQRIFFFVLFRPFLISFTRLTSARWIYNKFTVVRPLERTTQTTDESQSVEFKDFTKSHHPAMTWRRTKKEQRCCCCWLGWSFTSFLQQVALGHPTIIFTVNHCYDSFVASSRNVK